MPYKCHQAEAAEKIGIKLLSYLVKSILKGLFSQGIRLKIVTFRHFLIFFRDIIFL
jgi:hypothetical protein